MGDIKFKTRLVNIDQRAFIINADGKVLFIKNEVGWDLPGGLMVEHDDWKTSLEQLVEDSLGLQIVTKQPFYGADFINPDNGDYTYMSIVECECFDDKVGENEFEDYAWLEPEVALELDFGVFEVKEALNEYLRRG